MDDLKNMKRLISGIRTINKSEWHEIKIGEDDDPCYWQRKEWVDWILKEADNAEQELLRLEESKQAELNP